VTTFITPLESNGTGLRLAVKDIIDIAGTPTTAGSRAVASVAEPAGRDAQLMAGSRTAGCRIVGKANLHELAFGASGVNEWYGTPRNPLDPSLVPGGSSSGSAVAVGSGAADVAFGSDTGGSIRVPAAFCGITGLKTTKERVPLEGVWPLAPSLDTVGPMARDVAGVVEAMALLEPGFGVAGAPASVIGRLRAHLEGSDARIEEAIDDALREAGMEVVEVELPEWVEAYERFLDVLEPEAAASNRSLLADPALLSQLSAPVRARLERGRAVSAERVQQADRFRGQWKLRLDRVFERVELLALPTVGFFPPPLEEAASHTYTRGTAPVNLAGLPALAMPVRGATRLPASLQLVGPAGGEELLCATAALVERAAGRTIPA
jgi:amidase